MTTAVARSSARQHVISAYLDITYLNFVSGTDAAAIELPQGAVVVGGDVVVDTAWNSATSDVISVGDPVTYNRYLSAQSIAAAARTAIVPTGYIYIAPTLISVRWVGAGTAPSAGAGRVRVDYIVRGRSQFPQGKDQGVRLA
jgi:hypothetical protein